MNPRTQIAPAQPDASASSPMLSCSEVAQRMVAASAVDVETRDGGTVEVWTINADGDTVQASGLRLQLWGGMQLSWRFLDDDGTPYRAEIDVLESRFRSSSRADLTLQVMAVTVDRSSRAHARYPVTGAASLTAVNCERIVDGDRLHAAFHNLSLSGMALVVFDGRVRPGDRFILRSRFMEGAIDTEIRVARVGRSPGGQDLLVGAFFLHPTPNLAATVQAIVERFGLHRRSTTGAGIREALGIDLDNDGDIRSPASTGPTFIPYPGLA
jgi:hypothetical protein